MHTVRYYHVSYCIPIFDCLRVSVINPIHCYYPESLKPPNKEVITGWMISTASQISRISTTGNMASVTSFDGIYF